MWEHAFLNPGLCSRARRPQPQQRHANGLRSPGMARTYIWWTILEASELVQHCGTLDRETCLRTRTPQDQRGTLSSHLRVQIFDFGPQPTDRRGSAHDLHPETRDGKPSQDSRNTQGGVRRWRLRLWSETFVALSKQVDKEHPCPGQLLQSKTTRRHNRCTRRTVHRQVRPAGLSFLRYSHP
jgi:hypothetical protein